MSAATAQTMYLVNLAQRLGDAGHGRRGALIEEAALWLGCSKQAVYDRLKGVGFSSGRKLRTDKGDSSVTRQEVMDVAAILAASWRANGKQLLSVESAIEIALANDKLRTRVTPERLQRLMRVHGCHPAQLRQATPHVRMRSLHPNHVWQLDASICVLYRLRNGKTAVIDQRKFNERKPRDLATILNERILRYAITDHTSGSVFARYYLTSGEDQHTLFRFLMDAFHQRGSDCMYGVPQMMVWDAGSANQAYSIRSLFTSLMIQHWAHKPGASRGKGQVECVHNIIERQFEGRLAFVKTESIEALNAQLDTWLRAFNGAKVHSRHGHTRWGVWQQIREEQLRLCPAEDVCRDLLYAKPEQRVVNGTLSVTYTCKGYPAAQYSVAHVPNIRVGERVQVMVNPYRAPNIFVVGEDEHGATRYFEAEPTAEDRFGFPVNSPVFGQSYRAPIDTDVDGARKDVMEAAYGERDRDEAMTARAKGRVAFGGELDPFKDVEQRAADVPAFIQRRGTELHVPNPMHVEERPLTQVEALQELKARLGRSIYRHEALLVAELYPDGVPEAEFDQLLSRIQNPKPATTERRFAVVK